MRVLAAVAICILSLIQLSEAQVKLDGKCPDVSVISKFNVPEYMGVWYEFAKYPAIFETFGKCISATYDLQESGTVNVVNTQFNKFLNQKISIHGTAVAVDNAKLLVNFPGTPNKTGSNYWVLDTDYKTYSVVFSCSQSSEDVHTEILWILTRERKPSPETISKVESVIRNNKLSLELLTLTNQDNCK